MKHLSFFGARAGLAALATLAALSTACSGGDASDIVANYARSSFTTLAEASADRVSYDGQRWVLASPAGERFLLSADFARTPESTQANPLVASFDLALDIPLAPFVAAGLDPAKLPAPNPGDQVGYFVEGDRLRIDAEFGQEAFNRKAQESLGAAFEELLRTRRDAIGYHAELDHYGIKLGGGNMFEWAKDMAKNDKDLVFVLDPAALLAAGLDPAKLGEGWLFAKVESKDETGKMVAMDKILKPFDLR